MKACMGIFTAWYMWRFKKCYDLIERCYTRAKQQKENCINHAEDCDEFDPEMACFQTP